MAGDWIKVEHAALDKPEITRTAEMLGISHDAAIGLFVRFWVWLDKNLSASCPDSVRNMSRKGIDELFRCPGFSACIEVVGWAKFDDENWTVRVCNAERHNGNTAKTRALDAHRKRANRAAVPKPVAPKRPRNVRPREEKRRDITTNVVIESALPNDEHRSLAASLSLDCQAEFQKYRDWLATNGKRHKDAAAGFRNWLRRAAEFRPAKRGGQESLAARRAANMDALTGRASNVERPVFAERVDRAVVLTLPGDLREPGGNDVGGGGPVRSAAGMG